MCAMMIPRAPGFASMLKEGAKHFHGLEDVVYRNIEACVELSKTTSTSYGPRGLCKFVINHLEKLIVTSDAAAVLREVEVEHPAAKLVVMASSQQDKEVGDGTNFVIIFSCALLSSASSNLLHMGLAPSQVIKGFEAALKKCFSFMPELSTKSVNNLRDPDEIAIYLRPAIASKHYGHDEYLSKVVAKACITTLDADLEHPFNVDNVRVCKIHGGHIDSSFLVPGVVIKSEVESRTHKILNPKVAVYSCAVDITTSETKGTVLFHTASELISFSKGEDDTLRSQIEAVSKTGANVIVSGSKFSDLALHYIDQLGIIAIKVTSKFELRRIARATKASVLPKFAPPSPSDLGQCECVEIQEIGQNAVTMIKCNPKTSPIVTIVVRASTEQLLDDVERAIDDAVNVYKALTKDKRLVPGGGAFERALSRRLFDFAYELSGLERYPILAFAEALEVIPRVLAENGGLNGTKILAEMSGSADDVGLHFPSAKLMPASETLLYDPYLVKYWAIKLSLQAVNTVLRVDQIIMSKPAGGPKPSENKAWDEDS